MPSPIVPVILSGGSGTRLWPMSTGDRPKQFLALTGQQTMFQMTCNRGRDKMLFDAPIVVGNARHAALVQEQLAEIGVSEYRLLLEPVARNTAPAIALAALEAGGGDAALLVMPSDHVIADENAFRDAVIAALPAARAGWLVTFGITPTGPETGYGYIELADAPAGDGPARKAARFVEKPPLEKAQAMLEAGNFVWNAGIFLFRADAFLSALSNYAPAMFDAVSVSHAAARHDGAHILPDPESFAAAPADSIDYAVMEKARNVAVMPVSCGWSDLGSWDALHDIAAKDSSGNQIAGDVQLIEVANSLIRSDGVRISICGLSDLLVIASGNDVIILPRGASQDVKKLYEARNCDR